jgi:hypothetical protein
MQRRDRYPCPVGIELEPRLALLLEAYRAMAQPFTAAIAPLDQAFDRPKLDPAVVSHIPDRAAHAMRALLLERVVDHEYSMGHGLGAVRVALGKRRLPPDPDALELELAMIRAGTTFGPGVRLGALRLHLLDPVLDDLDRIDAAVLTPALVEEIERMVEHLSSPGLADEQDAYDRRPRLIAALHLARSDGLSPLAFDPSDGYGATMRALVESDDSFAAQLLLAYPLIARASNVVPTARWGDDASNAVEAGGDDLRAAVIRAIRPALDMRPPANTGLPGMPGALRITNQRILRGLLWLVVLLDPEWATEAFPDLAIFFGTSGRNDNTARDAAIASTCAALLGQLGTTAAQVALARMAARITNRPVSKHVTAALRAAGAAGDGPPAVEPPLPDFELDAEGRRRIPVGDWLAEVAIHPDATVRTTWLDPNGAPTTALARREADAHPGEVATVKRLVRALRAAIVEERGRLEGELLTGTPRGLAAWRARWTDHPIGRVLAERLVWRFESGRAAIEAMTAGRSIRDAAGRPVDPDPGSTVRLWHPAEADRESVSAWQRRLNALGGPQSVKQIEREVFLADPADLEAILDRRFVGSVVDQTRLRAVMRTRGWRGPLIGPWDGGDRATIGRTLPGTDWRAELDLAPSGTAMFRDGSSSVRLGSVRFVTGRGRDARPTPIAHVPPRVYSEALRDVHLFTSPATAENTTNVD